MTVIIGCFAKSFLTLRFYSSVKDKSLNLDKVETILIIVNKMPNVKTCEYSLCRYAFNCQSIPFSLVTKVTYRIKFQRKITHYIKTLKMPISFTVVLLCIWKIPQNMYQIIV